MNANMTPLCDTQSPAASDGSELESRRDVPQADNARAAGGPAHHTPQQDATPCEGSVRGERMFTLTDAEREAVERVSVAYDLLPTEGARQIAATLRGLLERLGGFTPQLDCGADRKSVASQRCRDTGGQPFDSAPITLTDEEREAVRFCVTAALPETEKLGGVAGELCRMHGDTLRSLLSRLSPPAT